MSIQDIRSIWILICLTWIVTLPDLSHGTVLDKESMSISDISTITIPSGTSQARFKENFIIRIPVNYFNEISLEFIDIRNNMLSIIDDFSFVAVSSLKHLYLNHNNLKQINQTTFKGLFSLETLKLESNEIECIEDKSFEDLIALTHLYITNNNLLYIGKDTLKGLQSMTHFFAGSNDIHSIQAMSFSEQNNLQTLALSNNDLKSFSKYAFDLNNLPQNLNGLRLNGNALQCGCSLVWLKKADNSWVTVWSPASTTCNEPAELYGRKWDTLQEDEMIGFGK